MWLKGVKSATETSPQMTHAQDLASLTSINLKSKKGKERSKMKKLGILNLVLVLSLLMGGLAMAQEGDFHVVQQAAEDWLTTVGKPVISADGLYDVLNDGDTSNDPFIVSVRGPDDYAKGHIPGAINIPWKIIADPANLAKLPTDQQIVVYCYTGHTGQVSATVLATLGYDVLNLKFGMMGWTKNADVVAQPHFGPASGQADYPVETTPNEATETYAYPALSTGETDAQEIVRAAAEAYLSSVGKPVISADGLFDNLNDGDASNDPLVVSVRGPDDYAKGHITGAINIPWKTIADPANLAKLPTDQQIVVYCYTGHTGQIAATLLNMLGYDALNLKFGMMGWSADDDVLAQSRFDAETQPDYSVDGTAAVAAEAAIPEIMPYAGGDAYPVVSVLLMGLGALTATTGLYLRRRKES